MLKTEEIPIRSAVASTDTWNVASLFPSIKTWEESLNKLPESKKPPFWPSIAEYRGRLKEGPEVVKEALSLMFQIGRELEKLYTYAHLRHDEEITLNENKEAYEKISTLAHAFSEECSW